MTAERKGVFIAQSAALTSLGDTLDALWPRLCAGESAVAVPHIPAQPVSLPGPATSKVRARPSVQEASNAESTISSSIIVCIVGTVAQTGSFLDVHSA